MMADLTIDDKETSEQKTRSDTIAKVERVGLNELWSSEPEFSGWLRDNIERLNEALGIKLSDAECEMRVGDFSADIAAEAESGSRVVIENQFGRSDHDHLGKLLTYLTGTEAGGAIWIVGRPRAEHVEAVSWLNEKPGADFWLVRLEAVRIGSSPTAPLLTVIVEPSEASEQAGLIREEWAERQKLRYEFFEELLERAKDKISLHGNISPSKDSWISAGAGKTGVHWIYRIRKDSGSAELAIETDDGESNKQMLERLRKHKDEIESEFGGKLEWEKQEGRRACYVRKTLDAGGYRDPRSKWEDIQTEMIDTMSRLENALRDYLDRL